MTHTKKDIEKVRDFLRETINPLGFDEVQRKADLLEGRYHICDVGADSHKISVMYKGPEDALRCVGAFQRARLTFQRPSDKLYLVQILIKSVLTAISLKESIKPPVVKKPELPAAVVETDESPAPVGEAAPEPEVIVVPTAGAPSPKEDLEWLLSKLRTDKDFGYTNTCSKTTANGKFRGYFFKTVEQAEFAKEFIAHATDKAYINARGLYVPSIEKPAKATDSKRKKGSSTKKKSSTSTQTLPIPPTPPSKKIIEPETEVTVAPMVPKTADDLFAEYKIALRLEIEQQYLGEIEALKGKLLAYDQKFDDLFFDNYVIPKTGTGTISFAYDEIKKGAIQMGGDITINKELLTPFCQASEKRLE